MIHLKYAFLLLIVLTAFSCKTHQNSNSESNQSNEQEIDYSTEGFSKAAIVYNPEIEEPCNYLIVLEDGRLLEPLSIDNEFKSAELKVWIKYNVQRRPSRCGDPIPVEITDIRKF